MQRSKAGAMATDSGRNVIMGDGHVDPVALNDFLVHVLQQVMLMQQVLTEHGIVPREPGTPGGRTPSGIILPGGSGMGPIQ